MESLLLKSQQLFSENLIKLFSYLVNNGYQFTLGEAWRTKEQQEIYIKSGRSKTMNSKHLSRLAIDLNIFKNDKLLNDPLEFYEIGKYWESLHENNGYGGFWRTMRDFPHFEMRELKE